MSKLSLLPLPADPYPLYNYLLTELNKFNLLYVHLVEPRVGKQMNIIDVDNSAKSLKPFKKLSNAAFIAAGGYGPSFQWVFARDASFAAWLLRLLSSNAKHVHCASSYHTF